MENEELTPESTPSELTPDEAAASLSLASHISEKVLLKPEAPEEDEPKEKKEGAGEKIKKTIKKIVKNA